MISIEERIRRADERVARQERQKRIEHRQERKARKKAEQRRNYAVGEMVLRYFPQIADLESLEKALSMLVANPTLMEQLEALAVKAASEKAEELPPLCPNV